MLSRRVRPGRIFALLVAMLGFVGAIFGWVGAVPASATAAHALYTYDAPVLLSSPDTAPKGARGAPSGPGAVLWGRSASGLDRGEAAHTGPNLA